MTAKPSPELLEMARKFIKDQGVSTQWTDHRIAMAEFGEQVVRECARIAAQEELVVYHSPDPVPTKYQTGRKVARAILHSFNLAKSTDRVVGRYPVETDHGE